MAQQPKQVLKQYSNLSKTVDLIIVLGPSALSELVRQKLFSVPTIGLGVFDPQLQKMPYTDRGTSGVRNFSYALTSISLQKELSEFKQVFNFQNLALLVDDTTKNASEKLQLDSIMDSLNTDYQLIPMHQSIEAIVRQIGEETDAVFIGIPFGVSVPVIEDLAEQLIGKKCRHFRCTMIM